MTENKSPLDLADLTCASCGWIGRCKIRSPHSGESPRCPKCEGPATLSRTAREPAKKLIACPTCGAPTSRALCIACAHPDMVPRPTEHQIGGLTVINRTGEPFDAQEIIDALMRVVSDGGSAF